MAKSKNKLPQVYTLPKEVYFDAQHNLYVPIFDNEQIEVLEKGIAFADVPQDVLKEIYLKNLEEQKTMAKDKPTFSAFEDTNPIDVFNNVAKTNNDAKGVASVKVEKEKLTDKETAQLKMMCTPQYLELVQAFITIVKKEDPRIKDQKTLLQVALNDYMQNHKKALDKAKSIVED